MNLYMIYKTIYYQYYLLLSTHSHDFFIYIQNAYIIVIVIFFLINIYIQAVIIVINRINFTKILSI